MDFLEELESRFGASMSVLMRSERIDQGQSVAIYSAISAFNEVLQFAKNSREYLVNWKDKKIEPADKTNNLSRKFIPWNKEEDEFLSRNYGKVNTNLIAKELKRTRSAIAARVFDLELGKKRKKSS